MKTILKSLCVISAATLIVSCSQSEHAGMEHSKEDHSKMNHAAEGQKTKSSNTGHTTGQIISISSDGQQVTINHNKIEGIGMGAMTMGFTVMSDIDLSNYAPKDSVAFMVKKGRDGSYRITAMCNTVSDGAACLKVKMKHSGH